MGTPGNLGALVTSKTSFGNIEVPYPCVRSRLCTGRCADSAKQATRPRSPRICPCPSSSSRASRPANRSVDLLARPAEADPLARVDPNSTHNNARKHTHTLMHQRHAIRPTGVMTTSQSSEARQGGAEGAGRGDIRCQNIWRGHAVRPGHDGRKIKADTV